VHGATRPRINTTQLRKLQIRTCPLEEQRVVVSRVEALFKFADQIEARYKKAQTQVDKLTQSILAKAFRGELIPTEAELAGREHCDSTPG
jgi:type I restriction enzyme S subunit